MWTNNLIFVRDTDTGKVGDELCAIIDWQFTHGGCCVEDLCVLLAWALSPHNRRMHSNDLLLYYVNRIEDYCKCENIPCPFTKQDVRAIFDTMLPNMLMGNILLVSFLLGNHKAVADPNRRQFLLDTTFGLLEDVAIRSDKT